MGSSMLALMQRANNELGLQSPNFVVGSAVQQTIQQLALLNAVGYEAISAFPWQALTTEFRFFTQAVEVTGDVTQGSPVITGLSSTAGITAGKFSLGGVGIPQDTYVQSVDSGAQITMTQPATENGAGVVITAAQTKYPMPPDYSRPINRTQWDKSKHWEMLGPETPQQWQWLKSGYIATGPRIRWRILGNFFQIFPMVSTQEYLGFEYISKNWVLDAEGNSKSAFTADTDTCIFDDTMMVLGLKLKYFAIQGFETQALQDDFDTIVARLQAQEQGAPILSMAPRLSNILLGPENIPDSNYGMAQ